MSKLSTDIEIKKMREQPVHNKIFCSRSKKGDQPPIKTLLQRKHSDMDTSTPISNRREVKLIGMEDNSLIEREKSNHSSTYNDSDDKIPSVEVKAGMSDMVNSMLMTPQKEMSLEMYERKLAMHSMLLARAPENNPNVLELQEQDVPPLDLEENPFSERDNVQVQGPCRIFDKGAHSTGDIVNDGSDGGAGGVQRSVGMNGMNRHPLGG